MTPPRRILVPVDFSPASRRALAWARFAAEAFGAETVLLHVALPPPVPPELLPTPQDEARHRAAIEAELEALVPEPRRTDGSCRFAAAFGDPPAEILNAVQTMAVDLVVMGTHGRHPFARWFLGSVTERILRKVPAPILTVSAPGPAPESPTPVAIRRILYSTDLTDSREIALPAAVLAARRFGAELEVVHVVDEIRRSPAAPPYTNEELARERRAALQAGSAALAAMLEREDTAGVAVRLRVLEGKPAPAILAHAEASGADLIVQRLHEMRFLERALLGATAERIVRGAAVPVLSVPGRSDPGDAAP